MCASFPFFQSFALFFEKTTDLAHVSSFLQQLYNYQIKSILIIFILSIKGWIYPNQKKLIFTKLHSALPLWVLLPQFITLYHSQFIFTTGYHSLLITIPTENLSWNSESISTTMNLSLPQRFYPYFCTTVHVSLPHHISLS